MKNINLKRTKKWNKLAAILLHLIILVFFAEYFYPHRSEYKIKSLKVGDVSNTDIIAPFSYSVKKSKIELERERKLAMAQVYPYYSYVPGILDTLLVAIDSAENTPPDIKNFAKSFVEKYYRKYKIIPTKRGITTDSIVLIYKQKEKNYAVNKVKDLEEIQDNLNQESYYYFPTDEKKRTYFIDFVGALLRENCIPLTELTDKKKKEAASMVSETKQFVERGDVIVRKGDTITPEKYEIIQSMYETGRFNFQGKLWKRPTTRILLFTALVLNLLFTLLVFIPSTVFDPDKFIPLYVVYLFVLFTYSMVIKGGFNSYFTLIPFAGIFLSIIVNREYSTFVLFLLSMLMAIYAGSRFDIFIYNMLVGFLAALSARTIKTRFAIYYAFATVFLSEVLLIVLMTYSFDSIPRIDVSSIVSVSFSSALLSVLMFMAVLPIYERAFRVATDFWLMELSNLNHPLLKKLAEKAPGTFTHSVSVGNLASVAAEAVGANAILARVASYYHDIGKMKHPAFFIENQTGENPHDRLSSEMSARVIIAHVQDGVEIAEKNRLPREIVRMIKTHHGTSLLLPFYMKAKEQGKDVKEKDFRYPGPLPVTKEESIVMLADSVEAGVRSLKSKDDKSVRELIKSIIDYKIENGELKESQLTLSDIARIEDAFSKMAISISHTRIEYPKNENNQEQDTD